MKTPGENALSWLVTLFTGSYVAWVCYSLSLRVPALAQLFSSLGAELPWPTRAAVAVCTPAVLWPLAAGIVAVGGDGTAARLNDGDSGEWIESLAADALLRRESPVATIRGATRAAFASNGARPPRPRSNGSPSSASPASRRARARGFALGHRRGASCSAGSCPSAQQ